jgi:hypothetical protein
LSRRHIEMSGYDRASRSHAHAAATH